MHPNGEVVNITEKPSVLWYHFIECFFVTRVGYFLDVLSGSGSAMEACIALDMQVLTLSCLNYFSFTNLPK